jgi:hypothetical protein
VCWDKEASAIKSKKITFANGMNKKQVIKLFEGQ